MKAFFSLLLVSVLLKPALGQQNNLQVKTSNGILQGTIGQDKHVRSFKGVPFAQPPVGNLRWREPQPVKSWKGIRMADHFGHMPMQKKIIVI